MTFLVVENLATNYFDYLKIGFPIVEISHYYLISMIDLDDISKLDYKCWKHE